MFVSYYRISSGKKKKKKILDNLGRKPEQGKNLKVKDFV